MKLCVSVSKDMSVEIRETKWFRMSYVREEFKPGKNSHILAVEHKSGKFPTFYITVEAGGDDGVGREAVEKFAKSLPVTVDASYLKSFAKKRGLHVQED